MNFLHLPSLESHRAYTSGGHAIGTLNFKDEYDPVRAIKCFTDDIALCREAMEG